MYAKQLPGALHGDLEGLELPHHPRAGRLSVAWTELPYAMAYAMADAMAYAVAYATAYAVAYAMHMP